VKRRIQNYAGIKMKNTNIYLDWNCMMDDDVEEVGSPVNEGIPPGTNCNTSFFVFFY